MGQALSVVVAIGVPLGAGLGISLAIKDDVKTWYKTLKKPSWTPPDWLFGPVWTVLYTAMGYSSYLIWKNGNATLPLSLYGVQLVLNLAWSPLFFKKKDIGFALLDITALLGVLGATIVQFNKISPTSAYLLLPYFAWTSFATALTFDVWKKNPNARGSDSEKARKAAQDLANQASDKASELADKTKDKASELSDKIQGKSDGEKAKDKTEEAGRDLKDAAKSAGSEAKGTADKAANKSKAAVQGATS